MKRIKYIVVFLLITVITACDNDNFGETDFVNSDKTPTDISATFQVTQDNTGVVTIAPKAKGAVSYQVFFGDKESEKPIKLKLSESVKHTYAEGNYKVKVVAISMTGKTAQAIVPLQVSFKAPSNLQVLVENDKMVSKKVTFKVEADDAITYKIDFGDNTELKEANIGEVINHIYTEKGTYTIKVIAKGVAKETTSYTQDVEVKVLQQPTTEAPKPPVREENNVISIFSSTYTNLEGINYNPNWGQGGQGSGFTEFDLNGAKMLQYSNVSYQGVQLPNAVDLSKMEYLHMDIWTADMPKIETSLISASNGEKPVVSDLTADGWTSIEIPLSEFTNQGLTIGDIHQLKFVSESWMKETKAGGTIFIANLYFYKKPTEDNNPIEGIWKLAPEAGAFKVGPTKGSGDWWGNNATDITARACMFDDTYEFTTDGTFKITQGDSTWLEAWQGVAADGCGTPIAPHNGANKATYEYNSGAGTLTLKGKGAFLVLAKAINGGELQTPTDAPESVTYEVSFEEANTMIVSINIGSGFWTYKLIKETKKQSPLIGVWKLAPEAGAFKVGPTKGSGDWWGNNTDDVTTRACMFDDTYEFSADGTFKITQGDSTWLEAWQGVAADGCGTPITPHNGANKATYEYNIDAGTLTLKGKGAFLVLAKAINGGELQTPSDAPESVTYEISLEDTNTMIVSINIGSGFWTYKLIKQ